MFRRHAPYHPYKLSVPLSAGFRFGDYLPRRCFNLFQDPDFTTTRSPDPSPSSSPVRGARDLEDDASPTFRFGGLFGGDLFGSPKRPSTDHRQNAHANAAPPVDPQPIRLPPRRKVKGQKQPSFTNVAQRSGEIPPHRRSQQLKEKREDLRKRLFEAHERRTANARERICRLRKEAEVLMKPEHMTDADRIFLQQLEYLEVDQKMQHDLERSRDQMARANREAGERRMEHEAMDQEAERLWREQPEEEALEEQTRRVEEFVRAEEEEQNACRQQAEEKAMRADARRQRAHEAVERKIREEQEHRFREEMARNAKKEERRKREEEERRLREERERRQQEEKERRQQEERERRAREQERKIEEELERLRQRVKAFMEREEKAHKLRAEADRVRQQARERCLREEKERLTREEQERQARLHAEQARRAAEEEHVRHCFMVYEAKWNELRTSNSLPPIDVREMPWPVFGVISSADQVTYQDVRGFLFHPQRPGVEGKSARDKVKPEVLRFHPDKFNTRIVPKIMSSHQAVAQEIAGAVARILTTIMTEELEQ